LPICEDLPARHAEDFLGLLHDHSVSLPSTFNSKKETHSQMLCVAVASAEEFLTQHYLLGFGSALGAVASVTGD